MTDEHDRFDAVHAALDGLTAQAAIDVLNAVRADYVEWAAETGTTLKGGET